MNNTQGFSVGKGEKNGGQSPKGNGQGSSQGSCQQNFFSGQKVVFMNDPTINYVGSWTANLTSFQIIESIAAELGATLTFAFNGTSIEVIGNIPRGTANITAEYTLDEQYNQTQIKTLQQSPDTTIFCQMLFKSDNLSPGNHTLKIATITSGGDRNLTLGAFAITPIKTYEQEDHRPNVGAIIGGVLTGIIFVLGLILAFFYWRRRSRRAALNSFRAKQPQMGWYGQHVWSGTPTDSEKDAYLSDLRRESKFSMSESWDSRRFPQSIIASDDPLSYARQSRGTEAKGVSHFSFTTVPSLPSEKTLPTLPRVPTLNSVQTKKSSSGPRSDSIRSKSYM